MRFPIEKFGFVFVFCLLSLQNSLLYGQKSVYQANNFLQLIDIKNTLSDSSFSSFPSLYQNNAPQIPFYVAHFELPTEGKFTVQVEFLDSTLLSDANFPISKGLAKNGLHETRYDTSYFIEDFNPSKFFPQQAAKCFRSIIARDVRRMAVHIFPFKYLESEHLLKIYTKFRIALKKVGENGENELTVHRDFKKTRNFFAPSKSSNAFTPKYQPIQEDGDLLVVYKNMPDSSVQRFIRWKKQLGMHCETLKLNHNDTSVSTIKAKISARYTSNPDLLYLLLIGNENEIPSYFYKNDGVEDYYSDSFYGMLDGNDSVPELLVGRFSGTEAQNRILIDKTIAYEKYSNSQNYEKNVLLVGSNQGENIGYNNLTDWEHLRLIGNYLADSVGMTRYEGFDGSQGGLDSAGNFTRDQFKRELEKGQGFLFYTGHGIFSQFVTGDFYTLQVRGLENYNLLPIVISAACDHGRYVGLDCMAEAFTFDTRDNQLTGGVAFTGSSILMAWAPPMKTQEEFARLLNFHSNHYFSTLGAAFYNAQLSMLETFPTVDGDDVMMTWILFGDPSLKIRVNQQGKLAVSHDDFVSPTQDSFTFTVNEDDAVVTLMQDDSILGIQRSSNHLVTFENVHLLSNHPIEIVASKSNFVTYTGIIHVIPPEKNKSFQVFPNPTKNIVHIIGNKKIEKVELIDLQGKIISINFDFQNNSLNLDNLSAGIYHLKIQTSDGIETYKILKQNEN